MFRCKRGCANQTESGSWVRKCDRQILNKFWCTWNIHRSRLCVCFSPYVIHVHQNSYKNCRSHFLTQLPLSVWLAHSLLHQNISPDTHPLNFQKSHYDVIQVGLFCTHAGTKKSKSILLFLFMSPREEGFNDNMYEYLASYFIALKEI